MIDYDNNDCRTSVVDDAIMKNLGSKEDIQLYNSINIALELSQDDFNIIESSVGDNINFGISTKFPHGLPLDIGNMFFSIDNNYDVSIKETSRCVYSGERYFDINIKKE